MKIGILGSGRVGQTLAEGFKRKGHQIMIGSRSKEKLADWGDEAGRFDEVAAFGDLIVLAAKASAAQQVLSLSGAANLAGKTIIDATNPIDESGVDNGVLRYYTDINRSQMEVLQETFPNAHFVKAFNSIAGPLMVDPDFGDDIPTMFICGNSDAAKAEVKPLLESFGFEPEDMGSAASARAIEPLCMLYCIRGINDGKWDHAFKLLKPKS